MPGTGERDHYAVLGVSPDVDARALRRAYLDLARRHHPDRSGGDDARMRTINDAWATLGDPIRRQQYDLIRSRASRPAAPSWSAGAGSGSAARPEPIKDLDDDRAVRSTIVLPRWAAMLPTGLFALSIVLFAGGVLFGPDVAAVGLMTLVLSVMFFLASPFLALFASRRSNQ